MWFNVRSMVNHPAGAVVLGATLYSSGCDCRQAALVSNNQVRRLLCVARPRDDSIANVTIDRTWIVALAEAGKQLKRRNDVLQGVLLFSPNVLPGIPQCSRWRRAIKAQIPHDKTRHELSCRVKTQWDVTWRACSDEEAIVIACTSLVFCALDVQVRKWKRAMWVRCCWINRSPYLDAHSKSCRIEMCRNSLRHVRQDLSCTTIFCRQNALARKRVVSSQVEFELQSVFRQHGQLQLLFHLLRYSGHEKQNNDYSFSPWKWQN